jgi:hypothetical protein
MKQSIGSRELEQEIQEDAKKEKAIPSTAKQLILEPPRNRQTSH